MLYFYNGNVFYHFYFFLLNETDIHLSSYRTGLYIEALNNFMASGVFASGLQH